MPVILDPDSYDLWLDPGMRNVAAVSELLKPWVGTALPADWMRPSRWLPA